ncbi:MAG: hypothetical protein ABH840_03290 [Nanoarchaeota archaeon]
MRRESRNLVDYVDILFRNRVINNVYLTVAKTRGIFKYVPCVNCTVSVKESNGEQDYKSHVICRGGFLISGRRKAKEVATELWAYYTSRDVKCEVNDSLI